MRIIHPNQYPDAQNYYIFGSSNFTPRIIFFLQLLKPASLFKGYIDFASLPSPEELAGARILISEPDWERRLQMLRSKGIQCEHTCILPFADDADSEMMRFLSRYLRYMLFDSEKGLQFQTDSGLLEKIVLENCSIKQSDNQFAPNPNRFPALGAAELLARNNATIQFVLGSLSDPASQKAYRSVLFDQPQQHAIRFMKTTFERVQYFDHSKVSPGDVILNCGVADGFEIPLMLSELRGTGRIYNIDPLGDKLLSRYVRISIDQFPNIIENHLFALSNVDGSDTFLRKKNGQISSNRNFRSASEKSNFAGDILELPTIRLPSLVDRLALDRIDLIKFDIEGAEELVVPDLSEIITEYRPQLAISVYHQTDHLWTLPMQLIEMCSDYNFHFSNFSECRLESVFYCIPKEKDFDPKP